MRIIAGSAKGRTILSVPVKKPVKPISSRIRQSLFDIIKIKLPASFFLDLFAGTGAVGLEALSRGAKKVVFVEKDSVCVKVIEKNIDRLGFRERAEAFRVNVFSGLEWLPYRCEGGKYDLIFMGPPYRDEHNAPLSLTSPALENIASSLLLAEKGWVVAQHHIKEKVVAPASFELFRTSKYGDTLVSFFRWAK